VSEKPHRKVAVVMRRRPSKSQWVDHVWEPLGVLVLGETATSAPRLLRESEGEQQWLHTGFTLTLHKDEAEGYYMNVSAPEPRVFVMWRMEGEQALPLEVTASSDEASRWMDAGHQIDGVAMPAELFAWVGEWVENNFRPEPKKRIKPRSFRHPKDRV
jgi:hypothetical protein